MDIIYLYNCNSCNYHVNSKKAYNKHMVKCSYKTDDKNQNHLKYIDAYSTTIADTGTNSNIFSENKKSIDFKPVIYPFLKSDQIKYEIIKDNKPGSKRLVTIKHIFHLSDIHIRLYNRHCEYNIVFDNLYKILKKHKRRVGTGALIVITGDILHSKNNLSPEVIQKTRDLLSQLAKMWNVVIIAGNHDTNLANCDRIDALSVIGADIKNVHYLKHSGSYKFYNVTFGVNSIIGSRNDGDRFVKADLCQNNQYKIALYHGGVNGCSNSSGFKLSGVSQRVFDGYDYVLLGDIHQFQYLNKNKTIAYSSSLIQQNYGESIDNHGFIKWNLENNDLTEYVNVPNLYGYCTLGLKDGTIIELTDKIKLIPQKCRIRFILFDHDEIYYEKIINSFIKQYPSVTYSTFTNFNSFNGVVNNRDDSINDRNNDNKNINLFSLDIKSQNKLISEFINKSQLVFNKNDMDLIFRLNKKYNKIVNQVENDNIGYKNWKLIKIEFENMFSYQKKQVIMFNNMNGIIGIFGKNRSGKSSILDIILFCFFEKTSKTNAINRKEVVNKFSSAKCQCNIEFETDDGIYIIQRIQSGNSFRVNFTLNGKSLNCDNSRKTNRKICEIVGSYDDFIDITFSLQNNNDGFTYASQVNRKNFLYKIFRLDLFEQMEKNAKKDLNDKKIEYDIYNKQYLNDGGDIDYYKKKLKLISEKCEQNNNDITMHEQMINKLGTDIKNYRSQILSLPLCEYSLNDCDDIINKNLIWNDGKCDISAKIAELETKIEKISDVGKSNDYLCMVVIKKKEFDKQKIEIENLQKILDIMVIQRDIFEKDDNNTVCSYKKDEWIAFNKLVEQKQLLVKQFSDLRMVLNILQKKINILKNHKYNPNCHHCMQNEFIVDAKKAEIQFGKKIIIRDKLVANLEIIEKKMDKYGTFESMHKKKEDYEKYCKILDDIKIHEKQIYLLMKNRDLLGEQLTELENKCAKYQQIIKNNLLIEKQNKIYLSQITNLKQLDKFINMRTICLLYDKNKKINDKLFNHIDDCENKLEEHVKKREKLIIEQVKNDNLIKIYTEKIKKMCELDLMRKKMKNEIRLLSLYCKCVCKNGIAFQLLKNIIPVIRDRVNELLKTFVNFRINIVLDAANIDIMVYYLDTIDVSWYISNCSGFEKFVVNLAFRIVIQNLANVNKPNFLAFDEGWGCFDTEHLDSVDILFDFMKIHYKFILLITHIEMLKNKVDKSLKVIDTGGTGSFIY